MIISSDGSRQRRHLPPPLIPVEMINTSLTKQAGFKSSRRFCAPIQTLNNVFHRISPEQKAAFGTIESQIDA
jgi:hypothetical protein